MIYIIYSFENETIHYQVRELPDYIRSKLPMRGNNEIFTSNDNLVRVPKLMFVYMICLESNFNTSEWGKTGDFNWNGYLKIQNGVDFTGPQTIYRRIIPAGSYTFSNLGATYLFTDDIGSSI